jgi:hypothetical protein
MHSFGAILMVGSRPIKYVVCTIQEGAKDERSQRTSIGWFTRRERKKAKEEIKTYVDFLPSPVWDLEISFLKGELAKVVEVSSVWEMYEALCYNRSKYAYNIDSVKQIEKRILLDDNEPPVVC